MLPALSPIGSLNWKFWQYFWHANSYDISIWTTKMLELNWKVSFISFFGEKVKASSWICSFFFFLFNHKLAQISFPIMINATCYFYHSSKMRQKQQPQKAFLFLLCVMFKINSLAAVSPQEIVSTLMQTASISFILPSFISCPQKV